MHIHILGACGTFMGGVALLAKRAGHKVTGSDEHTYPPMSTLLESEGIVLTEGYDPAQLDPAPDLVIIGNVLSRGNAAVEHVLNNGIRFTSGPRWLGENY
ncbi:MAG: UDP-N-acetylmuramate: L-alanyl-gamma-D-glutamyl-meso-diaminopimelate ligase, partial [Bacteroidia bacterium]